MLQDRPLLRLFLMITLFIIIVPIVLWSVVQCYEFLCAWCDCCEGLPRPERQRD